MQVDEEHHSMQDQKDQVRTHTHTRYHLFQKNRFTRAIPMNWHPLLWSRLNPVCSVLLQLNLRLKALKRQMDEAEEEIDRLEHGKKKLQRDLDEQQEVTEQLQSQLKALRSEMRSASPTHTGGTLGLQQQRACGTKPRCFHFLC